MPSLHAYFHAGVTPFGFPGACPPFWCRLSDHLSKVDSGRHSMWAGSRSRLVSKHSHDYTSSHFFSKAFWLNATNSPTYACRATLFQLLFNLFVSSKRSTILWERTSREQEKVKQHSALKRKAESICATVF